jgi:transposase-like protein
MIRITAIFHCAHCQSTNIIKNGHDPKGKQQYRCKNCHRGGVLNPSVRYTDAEKERIINAYYERPSMRGIERIFGVARQTLAEWLKKSCPPASHQRNPATRSTRRHAGVG